MSRKELNLYKLCLEKVAQLSKCAYWNANCLNDNPFNLLPSSIIDQVIVYVARLSLDQPLKKSDLRNLIATGRIRNFKLEKIEVGYEHFFSILISLSVFCQNLTSIKLKDVFGLNHGVGSSRCGRRARAEALECVLSRSPNLESVESCIEFNLKALRNNKRLKRLKLNFSPQCHLYNFLENSCEPCQRFWPNNSLKVLKVLDDIQHSFSYLDLAVILKFCTELTKINCDISKTLEYLHTKDLHDGTLCTQYKLEKCCLGGAYQEFHEPTVSGDGVYIACLTCPNMKEIEVLLSDYSAIYALCCFSNLTSLSVQWAGEQSGNFVLSIQILLEKVGTNLKSLTLFEFSNIDFSVIGINCPNLEELRVEYISEQNHHEFPSTAFQKVISLYIEDVENNHCSASSLIGLLSNCINLELLTLHPTKNLTDSVLSDILKKNCLSKMREARIYCCAISSAGLENIVSNLTSLEYLEIKSSQIAYDVAKSIIHSFNPKVIMTYIAHQ